jgi:hypothetical protein
MGEVIYLDRFKQQDYNHEIANQLIMDWNKVILPELKKKRFMLLKEMEITNYTNHSAILTYIALVKEIYIVSNAIQALESTHKLKVKH